MTAPRVIKSLPTAPNLTRQTIRVGQTQEVQFVADGDHVPIVECVSENGVVRRIEVRCGCGKVTTLVCQYPDDKSR